MIRMIVDKNGDGHKDIIVKFDAVPCHIEIADSYYLGEFFNIPNASIQEKVRSLLRFWSEETHNIKQKKFIPFDLSDQYVKGFCVEPIKNLLKVYLAYTDELSGYAINCHDINEKIEGIELKRDSNNEWVFSIDLLIEGIKWSIKEIS